MYEEMKKLADYKLKYYPEQYVSYFEEDNFRPMSDKENNNWCGGNYSVSSNNIKDKISKYNALLEKEKII